MNVTSGFGTIGKYTLVGAAGLALLGAATQPARADLNNVDIFNNESYSQTSGAAPTTPNGYFLDVGGSFNNPGDFTSTSATYPGPGSPLALPITGNSFNYGTPLEPLPAIQTAFPFGTYTITASGGTGSNPSSNSGTFDYTADNFTSDIPALSAATYNALQGLDPATALTVQFNRFKPNLNATQGITFFTILGAGFDAGFLSPSTTSVVLPANTLLPNTTYNYELDFSDRLNGQDSTTGVFTVIGSDVRTDGTFTTGSLPVPEPASLALLAAGLIGLGAVRRRA